YEPEDLVVPDIPFPYANPKRYEKSKIRKIASQPLENLFKAAKEDGINLYGISGYRSYNRQEAVFANNVDKYGSKKEANQVSAQPGQSEHQTGLTMDVSSLEVDNQLTEEFGQSRAGKWLATHAAEFGFIIR